MDGLGFIQKQIREVRKGGWPVVEKKARLTGTHIAKSVFNILALPCVIIIRIIRPWYLIRFVELISDRIGHFAGNTELYLCELDAGTNKPQRKFKDICFFISPKVSNHQLATMWRRILYIWPTWIIAPIKRVNEFFPGWEIHNAGENAADIYNLLDRSLPHLAFTDEEEIKGRQGLQKMNLSPEDPFVCLLVRDSAYLKAAEWNYHSYRDSDIRNYVAAAERLADLGYFVIRMGQTVNQPMVSNNPKVIDYASNGMRSDFMDIYLGAKCTFCVSTGAGWDAVPSFLFRKPIIFTNLVPLGYAPTFSDKFLLTTKRLINTRTNKELVLSEIFEEGLAFSLHSSEYEERSVRLVENTPEEITDVVIEMTERIAGKEQPDPADKELQDRFWQLFATGSQKRTQGKPLHGKIRAQFGKSYLRHNKTWLQ